MLTFWGCKFLSFCAIILFREKPSFDLKKLLRFVFWSHPENVYGTICTMWSLNIEEKFMTFFFPPQSFLLAKNAPEQIPGSEVLHRQMETHLKYMYHKRIILREHHLLQELPLPSVCSRHVLGHTQSFLFSQRHLKLKMTCNKAKETAQGQLCLKNCKLLPGALPLSLLV